MVDGNEIWEALFGILKGNVPKKMNEAVCAQLAEAINSVNAATPTPPTLSEDLREALSDAVEVLQHVENDGTDFDISISTAIEKGLAALARAQVEAS